MGLDMYLIGRKAPLSNPSTDGFPVLFIDLQLGYWRKHPNLHGYIVKKFADGVDECQEVCLDVECLNDLIVAVQDPKNLPHTTGFFFGESSQSPEQVQYDKSIFEKALQWLKSEPDDEMRLVYYRASW